MARIEVRTEVIQVVRRVVVEFDERPALRAPAGRPGLAAQPVPWVPAAGADPLRLGAAVAGGALLGAAGLALGQAARRWTGPAALPRPRVPARLRLPAWPAFPALPTGPTATGDPAVPEAGGAARAGAAEAVATAEGAPAQALAGTDTPSETGQLTPVPSRPQ